MLLIHLITERIPFLVYGIGSDPVEIIDSSGSALLPKLNSNAVGGGNVLSIESSPLGYSDKQKTLFHNRRATPRDPVAEQRSLAEKHKSLR